MNELLDNIQIYFNKNKDKAYHYSSLKAIKGILSSGQIWMTHYTKLNDEKEILTGLQAYDDMKKYNFDAEKFKSIILNSHFFISSFTKSKNSEYHWRKYGDFCLEVTNDSLQFIECKYTNDEHNSLLNEFIPKIQNLKIIGVVELNILIKLLLQMKDHEYVEENELRYFTVDTKGNFKYRDDNRPYIKKEIDLKKVLSIWISPKCLEMKNEVQNMLDDLNLDHIEIKHA